MGGFVNKVIALRQSVRVIRYASVLSVCYMCCSGLAALNMTKAAGEGTFMYFAFGSNLLKERLQLANPSATFLATGRLKDYKLDFGLWGTNVENNWHGGVATIRESPGSEVWGVIWTLNNDNVDSLDEWCVGVLSRTDSLWNTAAGWRPWRPTTTGGHPSWTASKQMGINFS
ncbi:gamma-glutamylcyclotransferase a isoform X2 [Dunckerocampus dactyliophorus]|uniref:gamma-glutamylcyclotransferase a isoform X2 n=1 Tax=Dunckerocampus dactyliophorus TaxID=161453 RepID=UPI002405F2E5|nr:gamma-glutamylcyclotransferase a isoform X2 [Dunckerocampus dactyliophorus]